MREEALKALDRGKTDSLDPDGLKKQKQPTDSPLNFGEELQFFTERVITQEKFPTYCSVSIMAIQWKFAYSSYFCFFLQISCSFE